MVVLVNTELMQHDPGPWSRHGSSKGETAEVKTVGFGGDKCLKKRDTE